MLETTLTCIMERFIYLLRQFLFRFNAQNYKEQLAFVNTIVQKYRCHYLVTKIRQECAILETTLSCIMENILCLLGKSLFRVNMQICKENLAFLYITVQ